MLASVANIEEARQVMHLGADIIDLKDPQQGALGGLPVALITDIVASLNTACITSATIGDIETCPADVVTAIEKVASSGVDYVKAGVATTFEFDDLLEAIQPLTNRIDVVLVHFADCEPQLGTAERSAAAGIRGVMLDTAIKNSGDLTEHLSVETLSEFVEDARCNGLISGLAGSLKLADIAGLSRLRPDYLGFRGALCHSQRRGEAIDPAAVRAVRHQLDLAWQSVS